MTSKNGFEIRAEVLEMAKSYMDKQLDMQMSMAKELSKLGQINQAEFVNAFKPYTVEELMKNAQEFYSFVEKTR
jgi:phosphoserine phosphatase